jgi:hypothetical protein
VNPLDRSEVPETTQLTTQYVQNLSFDPKFNLLAVELVAYDRTTDTMRRVELVESTAYPGSYVLAVGNIDGSPISGGGGGGITPPDSTYGTGTYGMATYS